MNKLFSILLLLIFIVPVQALAAVPPSVIGRILLQVEEHGEAWYVSPVTEERFYLKDVERWVRVKYVKATVKKEDKNTRGAKENARMHPRKQMAQPA